MNIQERSSPASTDVATDRTTSHPPLVRRIFDYLDGRHGFDLDPEIVRAAVAELDYETARHFNYGYVELNLLSIFGDRFSSASIRELALASVQRRLLAVWEGARRVRLAGVPVEGPVLRGWDPAALRSVLSRGRGLILATAHIGPFRFIVPDLASMGFDVCIALDGLSARTWVKSVTGWNAAREVDACRRRGKWGRLSVCDVERNWAGTATLMKVLRHDHIVLVFVDGNLGTDGHQGAHNRSQVRFLNRATYVKTGVAQLAIATDAGLMSAFARRTDDGDAIHLGRCSTFPQTTSRDERAASAREWTERFYVALETEFLRRPADWEGLKTFHRWRVAEAQSETTAGAESLATAVDHVAEALAKGAVFHMKRGRVSLFTRRPPVLWDVETLRGYRFGEEWGDVIHRLHDGPGVGLDSVRRDGTDRETSDVIALLATLQSRGLLHTTWQGPLVQSRLESTGTGV